jgi:hypothetical protein
MQLYHEGQNMSFISKNAFTKREIPFLRRFEGGMVYTCGLDSVGGREGYELHGSFHNTPAEVVRAERTDEEIVIEANIRDTSLFGKNLVLRRKISSKIGSDSVKIEDALINLGYKDEEYCLLYHINVGYPMLDDGGKILADVDEVISRTEWSKKHEASILKTSMPVDNGEEFCYFVRLRKPEVSLVNERIGKTFTVSYSNDTLPHFVEWKSMVSGDYALGLEPCTTELDDRFAYKTVKAGEKISFFVELSVKKN